MKKEINQYYNHKILNLNFLLKKMRNRGDKKVVMCHGVFDVVHPGHVRHLVYAKSKADILVVSITADKFIKKGIYRPHVPEKIRALNLAAFEMVDYVIIDNNDKPINIIKKIKPDFFAKGFEYTSVGLPKATREEQNVVNRNGGKMLFTPGDVVYSSTKILKLDLPKLHMEKLYFLMKENNIDFEYLKKVINNFKKYKVHVVGDTIIDTYTRTNFIGGQTKSPTFSVLYRNHEDYIGGAGIVSKHLSMAGAKVVFTTVLGDDKLKDFVVRELKKSKIKLNAFIDNTRPTINKNVIISKNYRLLKIDTLDNQPVSQSIVKSMGDKIKREKSDAVIFSDFRHGIFNNLSIKSLCSSIPKKLLKVADSQVASRWGNITDFKNFDIITPNEREGRFATADQDSTVGSLATKIQVKSKCKNLILKLSERGIFCSTTKKIKNSYFSIDSFANPSNVVDPVGSGDALLAYSTLAMLDTKSILVAGIIGSIAAACECEFDGNIPVSFKKVLEKINQLEKLSSYISE